MSAVERPAAAVQCGALHAQGGARPEAAATDAAAGMASEPMPSSLASPPLTLPPSAGGEPPGDAGLKVPSSTAWMSFSVSVSCSSSALANVCSSCSSAVSMSFTRWYDSRRMRPTSWSTCSRSGPPERPSSMSVSTCMGPMRSLMPQSATMCRARRVACLRSLVAPDVTLLEPKMSSSATLPPMQTSMLASICSCVTEYSSLRGTCVTMPSACPRGTMVALWMGLAPCVLRATSACPPSWYAVSLRDSSVRVRLLRSTPMRILSRASSSIAGVMTSLLVLAAMSAASLTRLASWAPLKPGVLRASSCRSTCTLIGLSFM
mmetsp:Transcript_25552/g.64281  ORF Transcript_25552/g.64281 Transcript_25552/m.64281 type:complete len:319 (+) Transcript_25552:154-1110(+)